MSDTPRTDEIDAEAKDQYGKDYFPGIMRQHARQLERELNAVKTTLQSVLQQNALARIDAMKDDPRINLD